MGYCSQDDLLTRITLEELAELTAESGSEVDSAKINQAIGEAGREIDAYCGGRYQVPFDPTPMLIRSLCIDLALYKLYQRRDLGDQESRKGAAKEARDLLTLISQGKAVVPGAESQQAPSAPAGSNVDITSAERRYTVDTMRDF